MPATSLLPGYREVDAFGPDEEYESEEEVSYVTLDLGSVEPTLVPSSSSYRLIGLDSPTPFLQLSGTIFKGQHQTLLGTELLFTDAKDDHPDRSKKSLVSVGTTEQRIRFKEVELREKKADGSFDTQAALLTKGKVKKERIPETLGQVTGSSVVEPEQRRARKGRARAQGEAKSQSKGKGKGKGKERATTQTENQTGDAQDVPVGGSATERGQIDRAEGQIEDLYADTAQEPGRGVLDGGVVREMQTDPPPDAVSAAIIDEQGPVPMEIDRTTG